LKSKIKNSFYSPFTFWPASSVWPVLLFLRTGQLRSAFRPKPAHPCPSPFLLPPARAVSTAGPHRAARRLPLHTMEPKLNHCATSFNSPPSMGTARYPSFLPFKKLKPTPLNAAHPLSTSRGPTKVTPSTTATRLTSHSIFLLSSMLHLASHQARSAATLSHRRPATSSLPSALRSVGEVPHDLLVP
jgi:hypothetical protein